MFRRPLLPLLALAALLALPPACRALSCYDCWDIIKKTDSSTVGNILGSFHTLKTSGSTVPSCTGFDFTDKYKKSCGTTAKSCGRYVEDGTIHGLACIDDMKLDGCVTTGRGEACFCSTDYCNSAGLATPALLLLLLPAALMAAFYSRQ